MKSHPVVQSSPVLLSSDPDPDSIVFYLRGTGNIPVARIYANGIVETHQGYDADSVASHFWNFTSIRSTSVSFFPDEQGTALVTIHTATRTLAYRNGYTPDPVARALWEALVRAFTTKAVPL